MTTISDELPVRPNLVAGRWVSGGAPQTQSTVRAANPDLVVGRYAVAAARHVHASVIGAHEAQATWAGRGAHERGRVLMSAAEGLRRRASELTSLISDESGKTHREAAGEVERAVDIVEYYAAEPLRNLGHVVESTRPGVDIEVTREPLGVVAAITPSNFPIAIPAWKIAPALAFGNAVVLKPSELSPGAAVILIEELVAAGVTDGALSLVMGPGDQVASTLVHHPGVDAVTFTGSTLVGTQVAVTAAARGIPAQVEMGGKNALVVLHDADLELAVQLAVDGVTGSAGQRCTATARIIAVASVYDDFRNRLVRAFDGLRVGDPSLDDTQVGPLCSPVQKERVLSAVADALAKGSILLTHDRLDLGGRYVRPILLAEQDRTTAVWRDEVFGPVAVLHRVETEAGALAAANDTAFGLSASVVTRSLGSARRFQRALRTGLVMINLPTAGIDHHVPFGGRGRSGYGGSEQGWAARSFFTREKTSYVAS